MFDGNSFGSIHGSTKILMFDASIPFFWGPKTGPGSEFSQSHGHQGDDENGAPHGHREEPLKGRGRRDFVHATGEPHRVQWPRQWPWRGWTMVNHRQEIIHRGINHFTFHNNDKSSVTKELWLAIHFFGPLGWRRCSPVIDEWLKFSKWCTAMFAASVASILGIQAGPVPNLAGVMWGAAGTCWHCSTQGETPCKLSLGAIIEQVEFKNHSFFYIHLIIYIYIYLQYYFGM